MLYRLARPVVSLLLALAASSTAHAFGGAGHSAVGDIAAQLIAGRPAEKQVQRILGSVSLHDIGVWADCVKGIDPASDFKYTVTGRYAECAVFENQPEEEARMRDYVQRNLDACAPKPGEESCHKQYHYANPALQRGRYERGAVGTSDHDLVAAISAAVRVLRGQPAPAPFSLTNPREALALLVHTVGDIHQPLHIGSLYLDAKGQSVDPDAGSYDPQTHTVGGNALILPGSNLHAYWDNLPGQFAAQELAGLTQAARLVPASSGEPEQWAAAWAGESILQAARAFEGLRFGPRETGPRGPRWSVTLPDGYEARALEISRTQMARGGARLAELLNAIWP